MSAKLVVVSGPSGAGKTTVVRYLTTYFGSFYGMVVTATTRPPRINERDGVDYHFLAPEQFADLVAAGAFIEHSIVLGQKYGTLRRDVDKVLLRRVMPMPLLNVDDAGMRKIRSCAEIPVTTIFISPPSLDILAERLWVRAETDGTSEAEVRRRLAAADLLMPRAADYDHIVENDVLADAVLKTHSILMSTRVKSKVKRLLTLV